MKRDELKKLIPDAEDAVIDEIMKLHGKDIEAKKTDLATAQQTIDDLTNQVKAAGETIEGFKKLDVEGIKAAADDWKTKAEQAEKDAAEKIGKLKFDHALEVALTGAKAKDADVVKVKLNMENLKLGDDGKIIGLEDQLKGIKESHDYLFEPEKPTPKFLGSGGKTQVTEDAVVSAAYEAAGVKPDNGKDK